MLTMQMQLIRSMYSIAENDGWELTKKVKKVLHGGAADDLPVPVNPTQVLSTYLDELWVS